MAQKKLTKEESAAAAKALQALFASDYVNKKTLYLQNFLRGLTFGIGSFLGATVGAALLVFVLSLFSEVPLMGRFVDTIENTINTQAR